MVGPVSLLEQILAEIAAERKRQDEKWDGATHDDQHTSEDWHGILTDYAGWARRMAHQGSPHKARRRLIQVAAVAIALVEQIDRDKSLTEVKE